MQYYDVTIEHCYMHCDEYYENYGQPVDTWSLRQIATKAVLDWEWVLHRTYIDCEGNITINRSEGCTPRGFMAKQYHYDEYGEYAGFSKWYFWPVKG